MHADYLEKHSLSFLVMIHPTKWRKLFCSFNNSSIYLYKIKFITLQRTGGGEENNPNKMLPVTDSNVFFPFLN